MKKSVLGIGSALVDILTRIDDDSILEELNIPKGSMMLVDEEASTAIGKKLERFESSMAPGGSAANTIHGLAKLGIETGFLSYIGKDEIGRFFEESMCSVGVKPIVFHSDTKSGTAITIVSADGERTFATHLGASTELNASLISDKLFEGWDYCYIEGYLIANKELFKKAIITAKENNCKVVLDLASYNVVESNRETIKEMLPYIDIVFANEEEAKSLTDKTAEESLLYLSENVDIAVVKIGKNGSIIKTKTKTKAMAMAMAEGDDEIIRIGCNEVKVIDTTGAGDMYAAGFLYGLIKGHDLKKCGVIGNLLAESIIQVVGAKMNDDRWEAFKTEIKDI